MIEPGSKWALHRKQLFSRGRFREYLTQAGEREGEEEVGINGGHSNRAQLTQLVSIFGHDSPPP